MPAIITHTVCASLVAPFSRRFPFIVIRGIGVPTHPVTAVLDRCCPELEACTTSGSSDSDVISSLPSAAPSVSVTTWLRRRPWGASVVMSDAGAAVAPPPADGVAMWCTALSASGVAGRLEGASGHGKSLSSHVPDDRSVWKER